MRLFSVILATLLVAGCATKEPIVSYRIAEVPEPPVLTSCISATAGLPDSAADGKVIESLFNDYLNCKAKNEEALKALNAYRKSKSAK